MDTPIPPHEANRLAALLRYNVLDTEAEQAYDDLTFIAAHIAQTPIAAISLVDRDRQWFKSRVGLDASETPREVAFCAHAIVRPEQPLVVADATQDARFAANPLVNGAPEIRFYCGAPLVTPDRHALGTLCVIDRVPRALTAEQVAALSALSRQVVSQLELRRYAAELCTAERERQHYVQELEQYQTKLEQANVRLQVQSETDALTQIANRGAFDRRLREEIYRASRTGSALSLLLIDVDHFKRYNDTFGHLAGDAVLRMLATTMRTVARPSDFAARFGGEEFAMLLPATDIRGACMLGERLRRVVSGTRLGDRAVTISIGAASLDPANPDATVTIEAADRALYEAKRGGRNRICTGGAARDRMTDRSCARREPRNAGSSPCCSSQAPPPTPPDRTA